MFLDTKQKPSQTLSPEAEIQVTILRTTLRKGRVFFLYNLIVTEHVRTPQPFVFHPSKHHSLVLSSIYLACLPPGHEFFETSAHVFHPQYISVLSTGPDPNPGNH